MRSIREWRGSKAIQILLVILLGLSIVYMLILTKPFLIGIYAFLKAVIMPFLIALIISYLLHPIVNLLHLRKVPRTVAVLLIYSVFILSTIIIVMNVIPVFINQCAELREHLPQVTAKAQQIVDGVNKNKWVPESIRKGFNHSLEKLENNISLSISDYVNQIGDTINVLLLACIIPFLAFYMLKDFQLLEKTAIAVVPKSHRYKTLKVMMDIDIALGNYIRGQLIVSMIVAVLAYLGYWLIHMPYPLLLASCVALFNIIPYLGPFFGAAPALLMASTISWKMVLFVAIVNLSIQILESNIISPQVVGKKMHMHPLVIIFALVVGGELAGVIGLILAVPFFAILKVMIQHLLISIRKPSD